MKTYTFARLFLVTLLVMGTVFCYAPIEHRPPGAEFHRELSESELARLQGDNRGVTVGESTVRPPETPSIRTDATAQDTVASALNARANDALQQANRDVKPGAGGAGNKFMLGAIFLAVGLGAVIAFRAYANRVVPSGAPTRMKW